MSLAPHAGFPPGAAFYCFDNCKSVARLQRRKRFVPSSTGYVLRKAVVFAPVQGCRHVSNEARQIHGTANFRDRGRNGIAPRSRPASGQGRVSRASPSRTAVRNCTRDEGGPFGFGNQVLIPSHCKLLRSKAVVVSVAETSGRRSRQARSREASASKPLQKCRKRIRRCQNRGMTLPPGSARGMP